MHCLLWLKVKACWVSSHRAHLRDVTCCFSCLQPARVAQAVGLAVAAVGHQVSPVVTSRRQVNRKCSQRWRPRHGQSEVVRRPPSPIRLTRHNCARSQCPLVPRGAPQLRLKYRALRRRASRRCQSEAATMVTTCQWITAMLCVCTLRQFTGANACMWFTKYCQLSLCVTDAHVCASLHCEIAWKDGLSKNSFPCLG